MRIASAYRGRITATEVAAEASLAYDITRIALDELAKAGACRTLVGEVAILVYYFPEFENERAKSEA